jgi:hypothetical protein
MFTLRATAQAEEDAVNFTRNMLPILSAKCFRCHGPDAKAREAELRLDLRENAVAALSKATGRRNGQTTARASWAASRRP